MKTMIYCKTENSIHSFFMENEGQVYYLFSQDYRRGVQEFFYKGVLLNESLNYSKAHKDMAIERTMSKIPLYIKYVEKEYGIEVLDRTKRRKRHSNRKLSMCA